MLMLPLSQSELSIGPTQHAADHCPCGRGLRRCSTFNVQPSLLVVGPPSLLVPTLAGHPR
jgi:hypothetical protein